METQKWTKSSYKSAEENYLGKERKSNHTMAEPQVLRQWDDNG